MNIIYFGYDNVISCLYKMIEKGHHIHAIFTGSISPHNQKIIQCAQNKNIPIIQEPPSPENLKAYCEKGIDLFFSAEYPWKIPLNLQPKYAINLHPTLLPFGKGKTPLPHILLEFPQYAGISFHKMADELDSGDLVLQKPVSLSENESYDSLTTKIYVQAAELSAYLLDNIQSLYENATPQQEGSYWPEISSQQRTIDWMKPTTKICQQIRAFGSLGTIAQIQNRKVLISSATGIEQKHEFQAGTLLQDNEISISIATFDGFITILKSSLDFQSRD